MWSVGLSKIPNRQDELGTEMVGEVSISVQELLDKPGMKIHGEYCAPN